ncbi:MAG: hypothetical protein Q9195_003435 [Heterodermia aff. obscurata]
MISSSNENLEPTRGLAILPKHTSPYYNPARLTSPSNDSLNILMRVLLGRIPKDSLRSFNWAHDYSIEPETFIKLVQFHGESLRRLQLRKCKGDWKKVTAVPAGLQTLSICVAPRTTFQAELVAGNSSTLRNLELGYEELVVYDFMNLNFPDLEERTEAALRFCEKLAERADPAGISVPVLNLKSLKIVGWDLRPLVNGAYRPITNFKSLKTLILESCCGLSDALTMPRDESGGKAVSRLPALQSLTIRHEHDDHTDFPRALDYFLRSLPPLRTLNILLSGPYTMRTSKHLLEIHGPTLRRLVWDERFGQRQDLTDDRLIDSRDAGRLNTIVKHCPNLVELGISIRWDDGEDVPPEGHREHVAGLLAKLKHLKTLNIRNVPSMGRCSWHQFLHIETMLHALVNDFVSELVYQRRTKAVPQLRIIGLGALEYRDMWDGSVVDGVTGIDDVLRLRIWAIAYPKNALGEPTPLLTEVASGYPGDVGKDISEDMKIFEPYWLG